MVRLLHRGQVRSRAGKKIVRHSQCRRYNQIWMMCHCEGNGIFGHGAQSESWCHFSIALGLDYQWNLRNLGQANL